MVRNGRWQMEKAKAVIEEISREGRGECKGSERQRRRAPGTPFGLRSFHRRASGGLCASTPVICANPPGCDFRLAFQKAVQRFVQVEGLQLNATAGRNHD